MSQKQENSDELDDLVTLEKGGLRGARKGARRGVTDGQGRREVNQGEVPRGENSDPSLSLSPLPPAPLSRSVPPHYQVNDPFHGGTENVTEGTPPRPAPQHRSSPMTLGGAGRGGMNLVGQRVCIKAKAIW